MSPWFWFNGLKWGPLDPHLIVTFLLVDFNPTVNQELTIKTTTISYNILRIMSGYGGLGFDIIP